MARLDQAAPPARDLTPIPVRLPTGVKMFLILVVALLPLGLIAMIATLQTTRTADLERRALLRVAAAESARALTIELVGDMAALRTAANALSGDPANTDACARIREIFATQAAQKAEFAIGQPGRTPICGRVLPGEARPAGNEGDIAAQVLPGRGLRLAVASDDRRIVATAFFPVDMLAQVARPTMMMPDYRLDLAGDEDRLELREPRGRGVLDRVERLSVPLGIGELDAEMSLSRVPLTAPEMVALVAPVLMWITAALITWLVTDRLLLLPLKRLRRQLAAYRPGETFVPAGPLRSPAVELQELEDTFRRITLVVTEHEADLARGLEQQTRLTREVHHRVKNNLQVINSLISLHSRGAKGAEAVRAYRSIQRRVDALSVVHRNHFAELEVNRGVALRPVVSELASNIRGTAPEGVRLSIGLEIEPLYVTQDTAVAVAFLTTELVELAMEAEPGASVVIAAIGTGQPGRALLSFRSRAFTASKRIAALTEGSLSRVMEGLARQLRSSLTHDAVEGVYAIEIGYVARD